MMKKTVKDELSETAWHLNSLLSPEDGKAFHEVRVTWHDSTTHSGWRSNIDPHFIPIQTIGFLIKENENSVVVAASVSNTSHTPRFLDALKIPRGCIVSMSIIGAGERDDKHIDIPQAERARAIPA